MSNIFVDPIILMTPSKYESKEEVQAWLHCLDLWSQEVTNSQHTWYHLVDATHALLKEQRFPNFEYLRRLAALHRLDTNVQMIALRIRTFFTNPDTDIARFLEDSGSIVEAEEGSIAIHPPEFSARWIESIREKMIQVLIILCTCKSEKVVPFANDFFIATLKLINGIKEIQIALVVKDALIEYHNPDIGKKVAQTFPLLYTPEDLKTASKDLKTSRDTLSLWSEGTESIKNMIKQEVQASWQGIESMEFHFGERFLPSIEEAKLDKNEDMLDKIIYVAAAIIADQISARYDPPHHIHKSKARNTRQMTRSKDGAKAWRITLVDKKVGWRMQYWRIPTSPKNVIEFMIVYKKNDPVRVY